MSRILSQAATTSTMARTTSKVWLFLLKVYKTGTDAFAYYFVNDHANVTGPAGQVYTAYPFVVSLPQDTDERPPVVTLRIDNIDQALIQTIRSMTDPAPINVDLSVVLSDSPATLEVGPLTFTVRAITYDALAITADLTYEAFYDEAFPSHCMTPHYFPGIYVQQLPPLGRSEGKGGIKYIYPRAKEEGQ